tara:strand:- start:10593 stop:11342 length:750 start_codon:yes stop_codon:yes gene_type:complete
MKQSKLYMASSTEDLNQVALKIAKSINLTFIGDLASMKRKNKLKQGCFLLVVDEGMIYLKDCMDTRSRPIYCNFQKWIKEPKKKNLIRSMKGVPQNSVIIDATAGLGRDALILSSLSKKVIVIERVPWLHALLKDGINNSRGIIPSLNHIKALCCESKKYLSSLKDRPEVIYLDPLFERGTKSKAKKEVQALRELVSQTNEKELLEIALIKARDRVIVKRHRKAKNLAGIKPTYCLKGRVIRYDVYSLV